MEPVVEQRFADKKKLLIDAYYVNSDETEVLRFTVYRESRKNRKKKYYLVVHRYVNGIYSSDFISKTVYSEINMVGYSISEAIQALKQAIEKHTKNENMSIDSLWIEDNNLKHKAGITWEETLDERLEKILKLDKV